MHLARAACCVVILLAAAGCDGGSGNGPANRRAAAPAGNSAAEEPADDSPANVTTPAAAPVPVLGSRGLGPGLAFGMARAEAVAAATAAFGAPSGSGHNEECGEGPMDFVSFDGLQLGFQEGRLAGWSMSGGRPPLRTARGIGIGSLRSALGGVAVDEESSLGPEFDIDGVGGILDESGARVVALWAGLPCQFR
jgi:hypothetical protein